MKKILFTSSYREKIEMWPWTILKCQNKGGKCKDMTAPYFLLTPTLKFMIFKSALRYLAY